MLGVGANSIKISGFGKENLVLFERGRAASLLGLLDGIDSLGVVS